MFATVFPLRAILFQILFLLVAIAIESMVLRHNLKLSYKTSVEYAASINLLSASVGWILFLGCEPLFPEELQHQLMSYILFDRFFSNSLTQNIAVGIILSGFVAFFITFWVKNISLNGLLLLLGQNLSAASTPRPNKRSWPTRRSEQHEQPTQSRARAVLQANAYSFSAILILLLLRVITQTI
ncbi:MAG: filament integrity protein fraC [Cyanothece sp. SIO1E1]|nr:filament integrity protein fraC [Cyanothece sp. SIO1E1]